MVAILLSVLLPCATVEERVYDAQRTVQLSAGAVWLSRFDLQASPGVSLTLSHYLSRSFALDYLSGAAFVTFDLPQAAAIKNATGYVSDREAPRALVGIGGRYAFAYGKMLLENTETVVRFVPEIALHIGAMITTQPAVHPAFDASLGLKILLGTRATIGLDYTFVGSLEGIRPQLIPGGMPRLSFGITL
jgi:hypothetical protein